MPDYEIPIEDLDFLESEISEEENKGKVTAFSYTLAYLDDEFTLENRFARKGATVKVTNPVPVVSGLKEIGSANVFLNASVISCEVFLDYQTPERLDIENLKELYLKILGSNEIQTKKITFSNFLEPERISLVKIEKLEITSEKPKDPRIVSIK